MAEAFSVPAEVLQAKLAAEYERGRADREREIAEQRAAVLLAEAEKDGAPAPYEPSQIRIDVDTASAEQLRAEVLHLDNRLRWALRHHDDQATTHWFALAKFGDDRRDLFQRGVKKGLQTARRATIPAPTEAWGRLLEFALDACRDGRPARMDWHGAVVDGLLDLEDAREAAECGSAPDAAAYVRVAFRSLAGVWLSEEEIEQMLEAR